MTLGNRIIFASLFSNVTLASFLLKTAYPNALQQAGAMLFGNYVTDPDLRGWAFIALLYGIALVLYVVSIASVSRHAVAEVEAQG